MKSALLYFDKYILKIFFCGALLCSNFVFIKADKTAFLNSDDIENLRTNSKFHTKLIERELLSKMRPKIRGRFEKRGKIFHGLDDYFKNNKIQKNDFLDISKKELKFLDEKIKSIEDEKIKNLGIVDSDTKKEELDELDALKQLKEQFLDCQKAVEGDDKEKIERLYTELKKDVEVDEKELKYINVVLSGGNWGDIILRGIAGAKNWRMVEDLKVGDAVWEGFGKGLLLRAADSTGNAIGSIVDRYIQVLFDSTLGKFESFLSFLYRAVFHSACRPFTVEELVYWKKFVGDDLAQIETMIKNAEKLDSISKADILREYENEQEPETRMLNLWQDFVEDHAFTYEELAQEIDLRKGYYKKEAQGFGVVNCADRLINKLLKIRKWLLSVKSLRDFASIPEAKSIIPAMKRSIDNYFVNLGNQIKPLDTKKTTKFEFNDNSKKEHWGNDFGEGSSYPGFMTE
jgi:hypothetical protein